ncbi:MAG TPA: hypothetical protein VG963_22145 [Polyangiaceae bacterium]|nr:hypothetical protein [Polyangiaceae bacterium]
MGALLYPALGEAAVPGNTGALTVLADGLQNPTTVAVRDGVAFVPEGQLARVGVIGGTFDVRTISLEGQGILAPRVILPGNDFFPEGIALDPATNDLFVGSIFNGTIVRVPSNSVRQVQFSGPVGGRLAAALTRGSFGLRVDDARGLLWACDSNLGASPPRPGGTVTGIDLASAAVVVEHELPDNSICNDIILDAAGNLLVTESAVGQVFRIDSASALTPNSAQVFLATPELAPPAAGQFGANGLAIAGGILFVSNTFQGTLVRFDLGAADPASTVSVVSISEGNAASVVLSGPDGVLPLSDTQLLVVENGFAGAGLQRLTRIDLDAH